MWVMLTVMIQRKKYYNKQKFLLRLSLWTVNTLRRTVKINLQTSSKKLLTLINYKLLAFM